MCENNLLELRFVMLEFFANITIVLLCLQNTDKVCTVFELSVPVDLNFISCKNDLLYSTEPKLLENLRDYEN